MRKRALITGLNGMDGSHLADFLLEKDYEVFGLIRNKAENYLTNAKHLIGKVNIIKGELTDQNSLLRAIKDTEPNEVYNLAAQSFVGDSWNAPEMTGNTTALGVLRMLEAIRESKNTDIRFYQASSSEMFGKMIENPANENTPFYPRSPYGVAKLYGHWITKNYRESYNMFAVSGILFNHESERRGHEFVTRKISDGVARIHLGLADSLSLGNTKARRDWGYSPDFVEAMWLMLQQDKPEDYVVATGEVNSVEKFLDIAFGEIGITDWTPYVKKDDKFFRPAEVDVLRGDWSKAERELGWKPKTHFTDLVKKMVSNDIQILKK
jgi:GDPmannose 4,6-dehydratase